MRIAFREMRANEIESRRDRVSAVERVTGYRNIRTELGFDRGLDGRRIVLFRDAKDFHGQAFREERNDLGVANTPGAHDGNRTATGEKERFPHPMSLDRIVLVPLALEAREAAQSTKVEIPPHPNPP